MFPIKMTKLGADGQHLPATATDHVAVLLPDFGLTFTRRPINKKATTQRKLLNLAPKTELLGLKWDLPEDYELQLLVDRTRRNPAFNPDYFDVPIDWIWTRTKRIGDPACAWLVSAGNGGVYCSLRGSYGFALAVSRAGQ